MARRRSIRRVDSTAVQGEGSWVEIRELTHGEWKTMTHWRDTHEDDPVANNELDEQVLLDHVAGWNWCDELGEPLQQPNSSAELDALTLAEKAFLITTIFSVETPKN
jgi:hypothetical protein